MKDKTKILLISGIVLSVLLTSCNFIKKESERKPENLIIVTLDTTRQDFLGCYGNEQISTPNLDQFAEDSVLFENAMAQISTTSPSHATMFTGRYPFEHRVILNAKKLPEEEKTIAERMLENDFETGAFVAAYPVAKQFGFSQGFETFDQEGVTAEDRGYNVGRYIYQMDDLYRTAEEVNSKIFPWLTKNAEDNIFLWTHYYDPHKPLNPPLEFIEKYDPYPSDLMFFNQRNLEYIRKLGLNKYKDYIKKYMAEISFMDKHFGRLIQHIKELDMYDNSLIIVISDHGEGLGQHNWMSHCINIYEEQINIAYMIKFPDSEYAGKRIDNLVDTTTVYPTVMDVFDYDNRTSDKSVLNLLDEKSDEAIMKYVYGMRQLYTEKVQGTKGVKFFIRSDQWKYILPERSEEYEELYDLKNDPYEQNNLILQGVNQDKSAKLKKQLLSFLKQHSNLDLENKTTLDDETKRKLKALGYIN